MGCGVKALALGPPYGFAVNGDDIARILLYHRINPIGKDFFENNWIERSEEPVKGIVAGNAIGQTQKRGEPLFFMLAKQLNLVPRGCPAYNRGNCYKNNVFKQMKLFSVNAVIFHGGKIIP